MSRKMGMVMAIYGLVGIGFAVAARLIASDESLTFYVILALSLVCLTSGIATRRKGGIGRKWIVLPSAIATFLLLTEVVAEWLGSGAESSPARRGLMSAMLIYAFSMLSYSLHGERPPEFYDTAPKPRASEGPSRS